MIIKNPFSPRHPVNPEYFVNRKEIIEEFRRHIRSSASSRPPRPDNLAILGSWGTGKTSILRKFESISMKSDAGDVEAFTAFIELGPESTKDLYVFLDRTLDEIERSFRAKMSIEPKLRRDIKNWRISAIKAFGLTIDRKSRESLSPVTSFEDALRDLWEILEKSGVNVAILMFDDIHYLARNSKESLYDFRSIFQRLPFDGCNFMLAITGRENLFGKVRDFAEPFTRFFDRYYLSSFDRKETENAIRLPLGKIGGNVEISDDVIDRIYELTKGHPFFIHFIMHDIIDFATEAAIDIKIFEKYWDKIQFRLENEKFLGDYNSASENEKMLLVQIANIDQELFSPSDLKWESGKNSMLARLSEEKELLIKRERGRYSIYHPLFKEFLRRQGEKK